MNGKELVMLNKLKTGQNDFTNACKKKWINPDRAWTQTLLSDNYKKYILLEYMLRIIYSPCSKERQKKKS